MENITVVDLNGRLHSHHLLLCPVLFEMLWADWTEALLVLSHVPVGSIRVVWHRVSITLTHSSLRPSLISFSCRAVSLAYCSFMLHISMRSTLMKSFDMHMKAWMENEAGPWQSIVLGLHTCRIERGFTIITVAIVLTYTCFSHRNISVM